MGKKPVDASKDKSIDAKSSTSYLTPVGLKEKRRDSTPQRMIDTSIPLVS